MGEKGCRHEKRRGLFRLFPLLALLPLLFGLLLWQLRALDAASQWVDRSDRTVAGIHELEKQILDIETGMRGYVLTGQDDFLEPYRSGRAAIEPALQSLSELIEDDPAERHRLEAVRGELGEWLPYTEGVVEAKRRGEDPTPAIASGRGKRAVDSMRAQFSAMLSAEGRLRSVRMETARRWARLVFWVVGAVFLSIGIPIWLVVWQRLRWERALEESEARLRTVLGAAPVGMLVVQGAAGERVEANGRAEALFGVRLDPAGGVGQYAPLLRDAHGEPVPRERLPCWEALRGGRVEQIEMRIVRPDGREIPVLINAAPLLGGGRPGALLAIEDVTLLKELERLRAEWSSLVAHDLRQPLSTIALSAARLSRISTDPGQLKSIDRIGASSRRLDRMIRDLLDYSRLEARRLSLSRSRLEIEPVVREVVALLAEEASDRPFDVRIQGEPPALLADPDRLAQVLENLLTNAVKYGESGTPITVTVEPAEGGVSLAVQNVGRPIPPEELPVLFQRFHRAAQAGKGKVAGIGLGLYITRELVEAHGGRIAAESAERTTTFRLWLPAAPPEGSAAPPA